MQKRIGLIGGGHSGNDAGVLRGICHYARPGRPWILHDATRSPDDLEALRQIRGYGVDGIIACAATKPLIRALKRTGLPVVNTSAVFGDVGLHTVRFDDHAVGTLAADYFLERGFRQFGYFAESGAVFSDLREAGLRQRIEQAHCELSIIKREAWKLPWLPGPQSHRTLCDWLQRLPKPCAIVNAHDRMASVVSEACRELGIPVPEQVAVLGIDNYELICEMAHPPLSSIELPTERLGREAARLLDRILEDREPNPPAPLPPIGVITRQSTDIHALNDPMLAQAMRYIRTHACDPCTVTDVLKAVPVNRRWLERQFRRTIGRSPHEQIVHRRIEHARGLLSRTDHPIPVVARRAGYSNAENFHRLFRELTGMTPTTYRRQFRDA
jgi:LacI family transcriptional regulator